MSHNGRTNERREVWGKRVRVCGEGGNVKTCRKIGDRKTRKGRGKYVQDWSLKNEKKEGGIRERLETGKLGKGGGGGYVKD